MSEWSYFRCLSVMIGVLMLLESFVLPSLTEESRRKLARVFFPEEGPPGWMLPMSFFAVGFTAYTWYRVYTDGVDYAWVVGVLISIGIPKMYLIWNHYESFRDFVHRLLVEKVRGYSVLLRFLGLALLAVGFAVY